MRLPTEIYTNVELTEQCSKAMCCHEKALFYGNGIKSDPIDEIIGQANDNGLIFITLLYDSAHRILIERYVAVTKKYLFRKNGLIRNLTRVRVIDRNAQSVVASQQILSARFARLVSENKARVYGDVSADDADLFKCGDPFNLAKSDWTSLNAMCQLFMDEISHLSKRVDDFSNTRRTNRSFLLSIFALVIAILSLTKDRWWNLIFS